MKNDDKGGQERATVERKRGRQMKERGRKKGMTERKAVFGSFIFE